MIKVYVFPTYMHSFMLKVLNIVYEQPMLYMNGDSKFLFLSQTAIKKSILESDKFIPTINRECYDSMVVEISDFYHKTIEYLSTLKDTEYTFFVSENDLFTQSVYLLFCDIVMPNKIYTNYTNRLFIEKNKLDSKEYVGLPFNRLVVDGYTKFISLLSKKIYALLKSKSNIKFNASLAHAVINMKIVEALNSKEMGKSVVINDNIPVYGMLNEQKIFMPTINEIWMHYSITNDKFLVTQPEEWEYVNYENVLNYNDGFLYIREQTINPTAKAIPLRYTARDLVREFLWALPMDELFRAITDIEYLIEYGSFDEIISYEPFIDLEIINHLNNGKKYLLHERLDLFYDLLDSIDEMINKMNIKRGKTFGKCKFCIEGKIYQKEEGFYCSNCDFFLSTTFIKRIYGFLLDARKMRELLKYGFIRVNRENEQKIYYIKKYNNYYTLKALKRTL